MISHPEGYKPYVILGTTQRCNYRCRMCFWSRPEVAHDLTENDPTMSMELFERAIEQTFPYCSAVCLAGSGEFLADPYIEERLAILGEALRRHPEVVFYQTTNASLLTAARLQSLRGISKVGFTISIDTVDALTYASIRRPGTLSRVLENIRSLRPGLRSIGVKEVDLRLNMVLMKRNIFSLPDVLRFAKEIHAAVYVDHPQGFGPDDLHRESLFRVPVFSNIFLDKCSRLAKALDVPFERPPAFAVSPDEIEQYYSAGRDRHLSCYQLDNAGPVQILPNGDVWVCCQNLKFGNLHENSFKEIFFSPLYAEYREAITAGRPLPPCDRCRHLYRNAPFLYESGTYEMDIPPESRNLDPNPDFEKEGFFSWLDELSEERLRNQLRIHYSSNGKRLHDSGITREIAAIQQQQEINDKYFHWIKNKTKVVVYPAGRQSAWMLKHTLLSGLNIVGFSDRNPALHGQSFHGYPVFAPSEIPTLEPDMVLVASDLHKEQICRDLGYLEQNGIKVLAL